MRKIIINKIKPIIINDIEMYPILLETIEKDRYIISECGIVYDLKKNKFVNIELHKGYLRCKLYIRKGKRKNFFIHRLVAMTFIYNFKDYNIMTVDHKNCNKLKNHYTNLEWVTRSENIKRAYKNGLNTQKEAKNNANVYSEQFIESICVKYQNGYSTKEILNEMNLVKYERTKMRVTLNRLLRGDVWKHISSKYSFINT